MILYRLLLSLLFPALLAQAVAQALRGRIPWEGVGERLGGGPGHGPHIWVHGASLGEITSARHLIAALDGPVIVTCNTGTARAMIAGWGLPGVSAALAPFDLGWTLARFQRSWQPRALILIENELWPARMQAMQGRPVAIIAARLSDRTARRWQNLAPRLIARMLAGVRFLSAQDAASEARFLALGLPPSATGPRLMLKAAVTATGLPPPFPAPVPRAECLLAASTHEGDEGPLLDAFIAAKRFRHLILAPRHPARAGQIAALIRARGLTMAQRSAGQAPGPDTAVHLADTLGEMGHWYGMAGVTLIGGSFSDRGGHTPYEPAAHGSAILHGPDMANFAEAAAALDSAGAAVAVRDFTGLSEALAAMTPERQSDLAARATATLRADTAIDTLTGALRQMLAHPSA